MNTQTQEKCTEMVQAFTTAAIAFEFAIYEV